MKNAIKLFSVLLFTTVLMVSCQKTNEILPGDTATLTSGEAATASCPAGYYKLSWDATGNAYVFKVSGSPSTGIPVITPIIGTLGDNVIRDAGTGNAITFVSGISVDPATGTCFATTSPASNFPNRLLRFNIANPNVAGNVALAATCPLALNVSDIERNPVNGRYYAINRGNIAANNRIVIINPGAVVNVICLAATVIPARQLRGLSFGCNGQGYVMQVSGPNGRIWGFNLANGAIGAPSCNYPGPIAPGAPAGTFPEMGLHFDCACTGLFVTGNRDPVAGIPLMTDGIPGCIGGPSYTPLSGVIKPTVDFSNP